MAQRGVCRFFQQGKCRYGNRCRFRHEPKQTFWRQSQPRLCETKGCSRFTNRKFCVCCYEEQKQQARAPTQSDRCSRCNRAKHSRKDSLCPLCLHMFQKFNEEEEIANLPRPPTPFEEEYDPANPDLGLESFSFCRQPQPQHVLPPLVFPLSPVNETAVGEYNPSSPAFNPCSPSFQFAEPVQPPIQSGAEWLRKQNFIL